MRLSRRVFASSLVCFAIPALAQTSSDTPAKPVIASMTLEGFQQRVQALGFSAERGTTEGKPDEYFSFRAQGRKVGGRVTNPQLLQLFVYYTDGATLETVNEWNNSHFGCSAFVDKDSNAVLESDLVLTGGVTQENLDSFITNFRDEAEDYARFILDHKKKA